MATITDEFMRQTLPTAKHYTVLILKAGPRRREAGSQSITQGPRSS